MSAAKSKGTRAETAVVEYLRERGHDARRLPPAGSRDIGDISIEAWRSVLTIEVKAAASPAYGQYLAEVERERINADTDIGIVIHKPYGIGDPAKYRVVMTLEALAYLLEM